MEYNLADNIEYCRQAVLDVRAILLYSHLPTAIIALLMGVFVYIRNSGLLLSKILLAISVTFAAWSFLDLVIWFNFARASVLMFAWSLIELASVSLFVLSFYFTYVFIEGRDLPFGTKLLLAAPVLPALALSFTDLNLAGYDLQECIAVESEAYLAYLRAVKLLFGGLVLAYAFYKLVTLRDAVKRRQVALLTLGITSFLYSFFASGYISEQTSNFITEIYGLFGMVVFIVILAYLIVRYSAFDVRLLGAQALVAFLVILVGAQFFATESGSGRVLSVFTIVLAIIAGYFLVRGVQREVRQREEIERLAGDLKSINETLEGANARLRELDQAKSEFVSLATHQIRSPLAAIKGYASMLLDGDYGPVSDQAKDVVRIIFDSCNSLVSIVGDFLDISRLELGKMKYDKAEFDMLGLVKEAIEELLPNVERAKLTLEFNHGESEAYPVFADKGKIRQIVGNLIDNATKYTPQGGITLRLSKSGGAIRLEVSDTGVGIDKSEVGSLFAKFIRAKDASKTNVTGTGLGLYIAKQMVEAHGGKIWAESEGKGKGSTFVVELPEAR